MIVVHAFYGVHMALAHKALWKLFEDTTKEDKLGDREVAVFVACNWKAVKLLTADNHLVYLRSSQVLTADDIRNIPRALGGKELGFKRGLIGRLQTEYSGLKVVNG